MDLLPDITEIARFCHCLGLDKVVCDRIEHEIQDTWKQTRDIASAWLERHAERPSWLEIIKTLTCMKKCFDAKRIADQTGVKEIPTCDSA